jgi:hypothetical protein
MVVKAIRWSRFILMFSIPNHRIPSGRGLKFFLTCWFSSVSETMASSGRNKILVVGRKKLPGLFVPAAVEILLGYFTPTVIEAELLAALLSVPAKSTRPVVVMGPEALNPTITVTIMA